MNIKNEQKKEYLKPEMSVLKYDHEGALLSDSYCYNCSECNEEEIEVDFH